MNTTRKRLLKDVEIHKDLCIAAGETVTIKQDYPSESLCSHPSCDGFFVWHKYLEDVE